MGALTVLVALRLPKRRPLGEFVGRCVLVGVADVAYVDLATLGFIKVVEV